MKKIISLFICVVFSLLVVGCDENASDNNLVFEVESNHNEKTSKNLSDNDSYKKGVWDKKSYYSEWLNLSFSGKGYGLENFSKINNLSNAIPYDVVEMKFHYYGSKESEVGIFLKDCNSKSKDKLIKESKAKLTAALENSHKVLRFKWKEDKKITLCNEEYELICCSVILDVRDEMDDYFYGYDAPEEIWCRFWRLCRIKDNKFVTIQIIETESRVNIEPRFETTISYFEEFNSTDIIN